MSGNKSVESTVWSIVVIVLAVALAKFHGGYRSEPQLGLWDDGLVQGFAAPSQRTLSAKAAALIYRDSGVQFIPTLEQTRSYVSCKELLAYYNLDTSRHAGGDSQSRCPPDRPIKLRLDSDR